MTNSHFFDQSIPDSALSFRMVQIPGGEFSMGSPDADMDAYGYEKPQHSVRLDGFWIAEYPVTQALWEHILGSNPAHFKGAQRPIEQVSWLDAAVFCNALSHRVGRSCAYLTLQGKPYGLDGRKWVLPNEGEVVSLPPRAVVGGFRLPTESEWEYAARASAEGTKVGGEIDENYQYAGSDLLEQVGWYEGNSHGETHDVGLLLPNAFGLYDMSGNVWEWCKDWWSNYTAELQTDSGGPPQGVNRVLRGGSWVAHPQRCRSTFRNIGRPDERDNNIGFRIVIQSVD